MKELITVAVVCVLAVFTADAISAGFDGLREWRKIDEITQQRVREIEMQRQGYLGFNLEN